MSRCLIINGKIMDLSGETKIAVTYQANNIGDLQSRQGSYTNTFKIPKTQTNSQNFEWAHVVTSQTLVPYRKLLATYIENGIETISEGDAVITSIDKNFYYLNIVSGNIDLLSAIGDKLVGDLYDESESFLWNTDSFIDSRDLSKYWCYPLIDWRSDLDTFFSSSSSIDVREMLPVCVVSKMLDRLSTNIGYNFTGNYLDSEDHKNMVLTPDNFTINPDYLPQDVTKASLIFGNFVAYQNGYPIGTIDVPEDAGVVSGAVYPIQNNFEGDFVWANNYTPSISHIGNLRLNSLLRVSWLNSENYGFLEIHYTRDFYIVTRIVRQSDGHVLAEITSEVWSGKLLTNEAQNIEFSIAVETGNIVLSAGETYVCAHDFVIASHPNISSKISVKAMTSVFSHTPTDILSPGSPIRFRDIFRMKVKDVLKDILNLRGVIIQTNAYTKEVQFNYFQDIVDNIPIAKDWSSKVDSRSVSLFFKFGDYAQKNWLRFKPDDAVPSELGDSFFLIDDETIDKEKTVVQINHSATLQTTNKYLGYNIPEIEAIDEDTKWLKPTYRLLQMQVQNTSFDVEVTDSITTEDVSTNIPFCRFVGFDELIPNYYSALASILDKTKGLKLPLKLTAIDITELDFSIPIFLDIIDLNINGYFYLNKVENFRGGELTMCEFIRL